MALAKTMTLKNNFNENSIFTNAYIKVESVEATKESMKIAVCIYKQKDSDVLRTKQYKSAVDLTGNNFIAQAYKYLKTLPEFTDAVDC